MDPRFGISIHLAIDGLSLLMVVLPVCSVCWRYSVRGKRSKNIRLLPPQPDVDPGRRYRRVPCIDMFLFFFFWEMMLVPMYFLSHCGGIKPLTVKRVSRRQPILHLHPGEWSGDVDRHPGAGFVHYNATGVWTFNYEELLNTQCLTAWNIC